jgi:hypothetical protein
MIQEFEVRQKMADAVEMKISVIDFIRWIMSNSWNMHRDSSREAVDLVSQIHLLMAERDDFLLSDPEFLYELLRLNRALSIRTFSIKIAEHKFRHVKILQESSISSVEEHFESPAVKPVPSAAPPVLVYSTQL